MILIDGHNLLFASRTRFAAQLLDGHPGTAAREALVQQLVAVFDQPGQLVRVYFDGSEAHAEQRSAQVEVIYPGGTGHERADRAILDALRALGSNHSDAPVVVTRDLKLARRAHRRGATVVDPAVFMADCDQAVMAG